MLVMAAGNRVVLLTLPHMVRMRPVSRVGCMRNTERVVAHAGLMGLPGLGANHRIGQGRAGYISWGTQGAE